MITLRPVCPPLGRLTTTVQQDQRCTAKRSKVLKYLKIQRGRVHERNVKKKTCCRGDDSRCKQDQKTQKK